MSINGEIQESKVDPDEVEIQDPELWKKIERSNSMERVNASPLWLGIIPPHKPGFKFGEDCSDCDSDNGLSHLVGVYECRICVINAIGAPVSLGFLCYYTWWNPEKSECWVTPGGDDAYSEPQDLPDEYDIANLWHTWLIFGVVMTALYLIWALFHLIVFLCKRTPHLDE